MNNYPLRAAAVNNKLPQTLSLRLADKDKLYTAYMPFIIGGGLFITTDLPYQLGDCLNLQLNLLGKDYRLSVKVIWLTPTLAQGGKPAGVGVQLLDEAGRIVAQQIEDELGNLPQTDKRTYTM